MLIRILGEKNSVKRFIMTFSLSVLLLMSIFGAISFLQIVTTRHYDDMLQNIVSIEEGQRLTDELKHSAEKYAEARKWPDYVQAQTARESLDGILDRIEAVSMDRSSLLAVRSIRELLENMDEQLAKLRSWEYDGLFQLSERCDNARYLLTRIQMLEANYASAAYPRMNRYMVHLTRTAAVILFLLLLEAVLFCMGLHEQIYEPIQRLVSGVQEISKGNFQCPDIKVAKSKEFDYLAEEVNRMKRDLSSLMETREEKLNAERLLQEAQFLALQSQVNPHFLFNVLGATAATALEEGADKTMSIVESISQMLRYSLRSMKTRVTLRDEMGMVENYFFLQNQRFGDRISFAMELDEAVLDVPIPSMTVQPIVENAVIHGCEKMESGGWVKVICRPDEEGKYAVVTVENNGGVISDTQIQCFYAGQSLPNSGKTTGIGLGNVRDRMRYCYDRKDLMDCAAVHGKINVVTLRYPLSGRPS